MKKADPHQTKMHLRTLMVLVGIFSFLLTFLDNIPEVFAAGYVTYTEPGATPVTSSGDYLAFWILAGLTALFAIGTITRRNPVTAAVCLIGSLCSSAGLYVLLHASFMAAIQVLVYAGAIMVLFIMVVMTVEHPEEEEIGFRHGKVFKVLGLLAIGVLFYRLAAIILTADRGRLSLVSPQFGDVEHMGKLLFSDYLFPFEIISILLLAAIIGAITVSRKQERSRGED